MIRLPRVLNDVLYLYWIYKHNNCETCSVVKKELEVWTIFNWVVFFQRIAMWKLQCRNKYLLISQSRFIYVPCLCPFCAGQIGNEIRYFYFLRFCWRKANICWKYSCLFKLPNTFTRYKIYWTQNIKMIWRKFKTDLLGYCIHKLLMKVYFISFFTIYYFLTWQYDQLNLCIYTGIYISPIAS